LSCTATARSNTGLSPVYTTGFGDEKAWTVHLAGTVNQKNAIGNPLLSEDVPGTMAALVVVGNFPCLQDAASGKGSEYLATKSADVGGVVVHRGKADFVPFLVFTRLEDSNFLPLR
jgi:hypothetical protein